MTHSESKFEQLPPCTVILEPTIDIPDISKGVALIYNIEREFNDYEQALVSRSRAFFLFNKEAREKRYFNDYREIIDSLIYF